MRARGGALVTRPLSLYRGPLDAHMAEPVRTDADVAEAYKRGLARAYTNVLKVFAFAALTLWLGVLALASGAI